MPTRDESPSMVYWLESGDGRVQIRGGAMLVGRSPDCEIVIPDPRVSRHQLLLRATDTGVEAAVLGRAAVSVDGVPLAAHGTLRAGSTISLCGKQFRVVATPAPSAPAPSLEWVIEARGAPLHRISRSPYTVGGGSDDDLQFPAWPAALLTLRAVRRALVLEVSRAGVTVEHALQEGEVVTLRPGARIRYLEQTLRVLPVPRDGAALTEPEDSGELPRRAALEFMPRGGRVTLGYASWERTAWLADRRCDLIATLLSPPPPFGAGDPVPDEMLIPRVWPGGQQGRVELNTLVFRARKDLVRAELDGGTLIQRAEGTVRFCLATEAEVSVRTA